MEILRDIKIYRFCCKLAEHKILILDEKQWLKETMYDETVKIVSDLPSAKYISPSPIYGMFTIVCDVLLHYSTLYCAKGNYEFGISRVIKVSSLTPERYLDCYMLKHQ